MWRNFRCLHMWRNFRCLHMTDEEKSEMLHIWHVYDVGVVTNFLPQFTRFNVEKNWAQKYICGEKMTNMSSGGHWPWQATLFFWSLSYLGQVLHYCTVTPVRAAVLWKFLPSRQVITCCFLAFWKYSFKTCWWCQSWSCWCCWCQWWWCCCCFCCYCHNTDGCWKEPVDRIVLM